MIRNRFNKKNIYDLRKEKSFKPSHYDDLCSSKNIFRAWFHNSRYNLTRTLVSEYYSNGASIADFGCGNCSWNTERLPVIGIDYSQKILDFTLKGGKIKKALCEDIRQKTSLNPLGVDIVVSNETFEHIVEVERVLAEIKRVLKPGGILILSVPYDTPLSFWWSLYNIICFVKGTILGDELYKRQCGHVHHFSPKRLLNLLESAGFKKLQYKNFWFLTIFVVVQKSK